MNNYEYSPIADNFLEECHEINQDNVPEVGSRSLEGITNVLFLKTKLLDLLFVSKITKKPFHT